MTTTAPSLTPELSSEVSKAVTEALGDLVEKARSHDTLVKSERGASAPKSWFVDPYSMLDSVGLGYRAAPSYLTYETLRQMSERNTVIAAILLTRINQVAAFCRPQENKYSVGFKVRPRGQEKKRQLSDSEKERINFIQQLVLNTGREYNLGRDSFEQFMRKLTRDCLTYDQGCFEKVRTNSGSIYSFNAVPGDTIRMAHPRNPKGTPPSVREVREHIKYVQMVNAQIVAEFTQEELAFMVRNPRTHLKVYGYGFSELEMLITTVTSHLWAEEWNRRAFSQGSTVKGVFNLKGNMPIQQFEAFKRQWLAQVSGVTNAWKTPITNVDDVQWMPMQMNNTEMGYQMWMEYLIKIASAIFQIDPAEINFDLRGGSQQQPLFMSTNEAQQKVSKDRGLHPLLRFLEDYINKHVVWAIDPRFEFAFVGLDAKTEDQAMQLRMQQVQNIYTLNEVRAMEDLPPVKNGDVPLNATYTGYLNQKDAAAQQQAMMGGGGGGGGPPGGSVPPGEGQDGEDAQADPSTPYQGRFARQPHGDEEREGADNLNGALMRSIKPGGAPGADAETPAEVSPVDAETESTLAADDWSSTVNAALPPPTVKKAKPRFKFFDNARSRTNISHDD